MNYILNLNKMTTKLINDKVFYYLTDLNNNSILINDFIGKNISLNFKNKITCKNCNKIIKKSYSQGHCFVCMRALASCDMCMMKPELCHYDKGTCREESWGEKNCFTPHYVYLANTGYVKVGITRNTNIPHRWIDQGATEALPIFKVSKRLLSGKLEIILKKYISDKTNWRTMLKSCPDKVNLYLKRDELIEKSKQEIDELIKTYGEDNITALNEEKVLDISFPVEGYLDKITSFNFDKTPLISGKLLGIKGQYFILDNGVLNIRKFSSYNCEIIVK